LDHVTIDKDFNTLCSDYAMRLQSERETKKEKTWRKIGFEPKIEDTMTLGPYVTTVTLH